MPKTGFHTNPERRSDGHWVKSQSARYKLEKMMTLAEAELKVIADDKQAPMFERRISGTMLYDCSWKTLSEMIDQVYGRPQASVQLSGEESSPLIKGFVIPTLPEDFIQLDKKS